MGRYPGECVNHGRVRADGRRLSAHRTQGDIREDWLRNGTPPPDVGSGRRTDTNPEGPFLMTTDQPAHLNRRTLIARSAAAAVFAALASRLPAAAIPPEYVSTEDLAAANTAFALDLYRELRQDPAPNLLVSPYSISMALAMTFAGARGETAAQMEEVLGFDVPGLAIDASFAELTDDLLTRGNVEPDPDRGGGENGLRIANALWGEQTLPFSSDFLARLEQHYEAGLQQTDFINAPDAARDEINDWVEEQTEDRIQDIVPEGAITTRTRLVLANAIYFYG